MKHESEMSEEEHAHWERKAEEAGVVAPVSEQDFKVLAEPEKVTDPSGRVYWKYREEGYNPDDGSYGRCNSWETAASLIAALSGKDYQYLWRDIGDGRPVRVAVCDNPCPWCPALEE